MEKIKLFETRDFSGNFDTSLRFMRQNYGAILKAILYVVPIIIVALFFAPDQSNMQFDDSDPMAFYRELFSFGSLSYAFLLSIASFLIILFITAYMAEYANTDQVEVDTSLVWKRVFRCILPVFAASILFYIIVAIGTVLCFIPGIIAFIYLYFYMYVYVIEERGIVDSLSRSYELVKGNWWFTLGYLFVFGVISTILSAVFSIPTLLVYVGQLLEISFLSSDVFIYFASFIAVIGNIFIYPIIYIAGGILYFSYRNKLENVDMETEIDSIGTLNN